MANATPGFFPANYSATGYHPMSADYYSQLQQNLQPQQRLNIPTMLASTSSADNKTQPTISLTQTQTIQLTHTFALNDGASNNSALPSNNNNFNNKKLFNGQQFKNQHLQANKNNANKGNHLFSMVYQYIF